MALHIKSGIHAVYIFLVQFFPKKRDGLPETLEVNNFPFPEELDDIVYIRIVAETKNIIIGNPRFLLCCNHIRTTF